MFDFTNILRMRKTYKAVFILCVLFVTSFLSAQQIDFWSKIDEAKIGISKLERKIQPKKYETFELDLERIKNGLKLVKSNKSGEKESSALILFPDERGDMINYKVTEASVMHPELAKKFPNNRSFIGFSVVDPTIKIRFSLNEIGLSAVIIDPKNGFTLIESMDAEHKYYRVFSKTALEDLNYLPCFTESSPVPKKSLKSTLNQSDASYLKIYRFALSVTGEYAQFHLKEQNATGENEAVKKSVVMATLTAAVTKINAVLERDLAISLQLVANNDALIFLDPDQDPYDNDIFYPDPMLVQNQATLDRIISPANYDLGHLFSTTGGVAKLRSICVDGLKAQGVSGSFEPAGNTFYFDVVGHEIGHQLGANHTFNGNERICGDQGQRVDQTAVEPGSGSTIMSYGGYCGSQNVQSNSDQYFHAVSLQEINAFIGEDGVGNCANRKSFIENKNSPTAFAGTDLILPVGTPFKLTGEANDDDGDQISYCWEQIDAGVTAVPPSSSAKTGALYRSKKPVIDPVRYFPDLKSLNSGQVSSKWEITPQVAREVNFRLTVRDNNPEGGRVASDDVKLTFTNSAGPFKVVSQNKDGEIWVPGTQQIVEWDVAGTNSNGVDVSRVNILLSTDGGLSYPTILASNVANSGTYMVAVPQLQVPHCLVMVEAIGNVFFAVNTKLFSIGAFESVCSTYESKDIPRDLVFGPSNTTISSNEVEEEFDLENISVSVKIRHPFIKDLVLSLISPEGTMIELLKNPCGDNDQDIDVVFSDEGEQLYCASFSPTISGNTKASSELSQVNGERAKGIWKLKIVDEFPGDDGILESWSMKICTLKEVSNSEDMNLSNFQLYPNPSEGQFTIKFSSEERGDIEISLYDLLGRKLLVKSFKDESKDFDELISPVNLMGGIYLLKVKKGKKVSFRKLQMK